MKIRKSFGFRNPPGFSPCMVKIRPWGRVVGENYPPVVPRWSRQLHRQESPGRKYARQAIAPGLGDWRVLKLWTLVRGSFSCWCWTYLVVHPTDRKWVTTSYNPGDFNGIFVGASRPLIHIWGELTHLLSWLVVSTPLKNMSSSIGRVIATQ